MKLTRAERKRVIKPELLNVRKKNGRVVGFDINREFWGKNRLLSVSTGKMCCLGFYSLACGLKPGTIANLEFPPINKEMEWLTKHSTFSRDSNKSFETALVDINDTEIRREDKIKRRFARNGIEVNFV